MNFGATAAVIGHEMGHAFDDQGSRYDGEGRLRNGWIPGSRAISASSCPGRSVAWARLLTDPHSPGEFRVNGVVRNLDPSYVAFDVGPEDALYLPPSERVRI